MNSRRKLANNKRLRIQRIKPKDLSINQGLKSAAMKEGGVAASGLETGVFKYISKNMSGLITDGQNQ